MSLNSFEKIVLGTGLFFAVTGALDASNALVRTFTDAAEFNRGTACEAQIKKDMPCAKGDYKILIDMKDNDIAKKRGVADFFIGGFAVGYVAVRKKAF